LTTRYGHLDHIIASLGAHVLRGDLVGSMGTTGQSTGTHLHFEVRSNGVAVDPITYLTTGVTIVDEIPIKDPAPTISKFATERIGTLALQAVASTP
jgi:murein DD-endopeptidase MepM/ murein hydrolase activator NlpD